MFRYKRAAEWLAGKAAGLHGAIRIRRAGRVAVDLKRQTESPRLAGSRDFGSERRTKRSGAANANRETVGRNLARSPGRLANLDTCKLFRSRRPLAPGGASVCVDLISLR